MVTRAQKGMGAGGALGGALGSAVPGLGTILGSAVGSAVGGAAGALASRGQARKERERLKKLFQQQQAAALSANMAVASGPGVNPALARRNALDALRLQQLQLAPQQSASMLELEQQQAARRRSNIGAGLQAGSAFGASLLQAGLGGEAGSTPVNAEDFASQAAAKFAPGGVGAAGAGAIPSSIPMVPVVENTQPVVTAGEPTFPIPAVITTPSSPAGTQPIQPPPSPESMATTGPGAQPAPAGTLEMRGEAFPAPSRELVPPQQGLSEQSIPEIPITPQIPAGPQHNPGDAERAAKEQRPLLAAFGREWLEQNFSQLPDANKALSYMLFLTRNLGIPPMDAARVVEHFYPNAGPLQ